MVFHRYKVGNAVSRKDEIIERLKENGCRITKQRKILIDIILENDCASCKEIFYKASQRIKRSGWRRFTG